jgi:hypothetical protein
MSDNDQPIDFAAAYMDVTPHGFTVCKDGEPDRELPACTVTTGKESPDDPIASTAVDALRPPAGDVEKPDDGGGAG